MYFCFRLQGGNIKVLKVMKSYFFLAIAIIFETVGTAFLNTSEQFTKFLPTAVMAVCYIFSFYFLSHALKVLDVGIAYAIWSGVGIVLITGVGVVIFKQVPDLAAILGIILIVTGVLVINIWSKTA